MDKEWRTVVSIISNEGGNERTWMRSMVGLEERPHINTPRVVACRSWRAG